MNGFNQTPGFTIDKEGNLHCVWAHVVNNNFSNIYYSKSEDNGATWTIPENISLNNEKRLVFPNIVANINNQIFVSYDYNMGDPIHGKILFKTKLENAWSEADTISGNMFNCSHNKLGIDNSNRIYCFWNYSSVESDCYRYYENGVWSQFFFPYPDTLVYFRKIVFNADNNLQCLGGMFDEYSYYVHISYDYNDEVWSDITPISKKIWGALGADIDIDNIDRIHFAWRQRTFGNGSIFEDDSTLFRFYNGTCWTEPELVAEDPFEQKIQIINSKPYIIEWEKSESKSGNIVMYQRNELGEWIGELVVSGAAGTEVFMKSGNMLHFLYRAKPEEDNLNIYYMHKVVDTTTTISESNFTIQSLEIFPNPSLSSTNITFTLLKESQVVLKVYSFKGELVKTILEKDLAEDFYQLYWDGTNNANIRVKPGAYLVRLMAGRNIISRSVVVI